MIRQSKRIPTKRARPRVVHSERTDHITGHKRVRLRGVARDKRRVEVFERAGGRCEERISWKGWIHGAGEVLVSDRCPNRATEWSHMRHGSNKCDCLSPKCNIASCHECHVKRHNAGGKPCPKKPTFSH
jgi:hypothetical protein